MSQTFGMEAPREHKPTAHRQPVRYLVIIEAGGSMLARLFLATREQVTEFDAAVEEVTCMIKGLVPQPGALGTEWNLPLQSHNVAERAAAMIYTLEI